MRKTGRFPHVVIRASAGTGKTHQLAMRFIGLLAADVQADEILATTFTRKAAGEIFDRVLFRLAQAATDDAKCRELAAATGDASLTRQRCQELLVQTVRSLHRVRIGTLDSFFIQIATSFGQELGLPPGWSICDELLDAALRDEAIELLLSRGRMSDLLTLVHSLTKGDAARGVSRLVQGTIGGLLELHRETTPTVWEQLAHCKGLPEAELEQTTLALESLEIADKRMREARDADLVLVRAGAWESFICKGLGAKVLCGECAFYKKPMPVELVALYQLLLKHAESVLVGQIARQTQATHQLLTRFVEHYGALQLEERLLRFGDVTARLATASETIALARQAYRMDGGIRHVLLDEFQDTAPAQWRVIRTLAQAVTSRGAGSFFCVGDVKQAIYGWRGGVAEIFDALSDELPGLTQASLSESYRSAQPIIDTVNRVFQNLTRHPNLEKLQEPLARWQAAFPAHTTVRKELAGYVTLTTAPAAQEDEDSTDVLFRHAADRIAKVVSETPRASVGVLVRTNAAVARLIYLLRERGIAASEEGGNPLIDSPAVEVILSLLTLADHPGDRVARFHLATSPLAEAVPGIGSREPEDDRAAARLSRQLRRQLLDVGYGATVHEWAQRLATSCDERELVRLQQLVELAYEYQPTSTLRADDFVRLVQRKRVADPRASDVRVMTIHQAKGLQFDVVFLPELGARLTGQPALVVAGRAGPTQPISAACRYANEQVRQFFPPKLQKLFEDDVCREATESLCVLYVAMTRAVHALHMIVPPARANERNLPKSYAGLLRAALAGGKSADGGQLLYEAGDPDWFRSALSGQESKREAGGKSRKRKENGAPGGQDIPDETRSVPVTRIRLAPLRSARERGLERTSPSSLEGGSRVAAAQLLAPQAEAAFQLGTLYHAWLAQIEWLDNGLPGDDLLAATAARVRIGDIANKSGELIAQFRSQLQAQEVADLLWRKRYETLGNLGLSSIPAREWARGELAVKVYCERPFAVRDGDAVLAGSMDRLVVIHSGGQAIAAEIIDYKTDAIAPGNRSAIAQRVAFYQPQIDAYRAAASQFLRLDRSRIAAQLVFLNAAAVEAV